MTLYCTILIIEGVNHGDPFGHGGNWYTFCCWKCKGQLIKNGKECKCGADIEWEDFLSSIVRSMMDVYGGGAVRKELEEYLK